MNAGGIHPAGIAATHSSNEPHPASTVALSNPIQGAGQKDTSGSTAAQPFSGLSPAVSELLS